MLEKWNNKKAHPNETDLLQNAMCFRIVKNCKFFKSSTPTIQLLAKAESAESTEIVIYTETERACMRLHVLYSIKPFLLSEGLTSGGVGMIMELLFI